VGQDDLSANDGSSEHDDHLFDGQPAGDPGFAGLGLAQYFWPADSERDHQAAEEFHAASARRARPRRRRPPGNSQMLLNAMEMYLKGLEAGTIKAAPHPGFGDIGAEGWGKMHVVHTDHHLRQFGV
jgi:hypothetical protein